jgi:hypothetical protein
MLYSALLVATTAFAGFAAAQNSTGSLPDGFPQCCTPQTAPNMTTKQEWCNANTNTCVEICGTDADVATQGNVCSAVSVLDRTHSWTMANALPSSKTSATRASAGTVPSPT